MAARPVSYTAITDNQKAILRRFYEDSDLTTVGKDKSSTIERASNETGLSVGRVKKWIGNEKARRKEARTREPSATIKVPKCKRAVTAYNLFTREYYNSEDCSSSTESVFEKNRKVGEKWRQLDEGHVDALKQKAKELKTSDVSELNAEQKVKLISQHKKQLIAELTFLEKLGCESALLLSSPNGELHQCGSVTGLEFMDSHPVIINNFLSHLGIEKNTKYTYKDVIALYNSKYSAAVGKPGARVPYLKKCFRVEGLPEGIGFKQPFSYGSKQVQSIMKHRDSIKFIVIPTTQDENNGDEDDNPAESQSVEFLKLLLLKVTDQDVVDCAIARQQKITEEDLNVTDLDLTETDMQLIKDDCKIFFDTSAMKSLEANYEALLNQKGLIIPVHCNEGDKFWLFYCEGSYKELTEILNGENSRKGVRGHWLDKVEGMTYQLLFNKKRVNIVQQNMMFSENELPLHKKFPIALNPNEIVNIGPSFLQKITSELNQKVKSYIRDRP